LNFCCALALSLPSAGKLVYHSKASSSTHQLASAFGFNPYGSFGGSGAGAKQPLKESEAWWQKTLSLRNTSIALDDILEVRFLHWLWPILQSTGL
jgi:hypothetical protein